MHQVRQPADGDPALPAQERTELKALGRDETSDAEALTRAACPAPKTYAKAEIERGGNELASLPPDSELSRMMADYWVLAEQARRCER